MSVKIHPTAVIDPTAVLGADVEVGPYSIIGPQVHLGDHSILSSHVVLEARTIIGRHAQISPGAVIGGAPQDLSYKGEPTRVVVGDHAILREGVTVNRASGEGNETVLGNHVFMMAYSHLAHNCHVGDHVIMANGVQIAGHVNIADYAFFGGCSLVHQHCRIGRMAFLGGASSARQDLPPFSMNNGANTSFVIGINSVGLRRRGLSSEERQRLKKAFYYLWFSDLTQHEAIEAIRNNLEMDTYLEELVNFVETSKRGIARNKKASRKGRDESEAQEEEMETMSVV